jgi:hypothetical protein
MLVFISVLLVIGLYIYDKSTKPSRPYYQSPPPPDTSKLLSKLQEAASTEKDPKVKQGIQRAISIVQSRGAVANAASMENVLDLQTDAQDLPVNAMLNDTSVSSASTEAPLISLTDESPRSNAITLLYVGAFLFITAMVIFIAAPVFSGGIKTFLVLLASVVFYSLGLWMHQGSKQFKPAGQSFVAIGMIILPLVGVAAYNLIFNQSHSFAIWFTTSLVSFVAYVYALSKIRTTLMGYLSVLSALSLAESAVLTTGLPLYFVSWTLALISIGLSVLSRFKDLWPEQKQPLSFSAQLLLPTALVVAVLNIQTFGWWQFTAALVLASAFYGYCAWNKNDSILNRSTFTALSVLSLVAIVPSTATALDFNIRVAMTALLVAVALLTSSLTLLTKVGRSPLFDQTLHVLGVVPFITFGFLLGKDVIVPSMVLNIVIFGTIAYTARSAGWLVASFIPVLALPLATNTALETTINPITFAAIYSVMGIMGLIVRMLIDDLSNEVKTAVSGFYIVSLAIGFIFGVQQSLYFGAFILAIDMALLALASYVEQKTELFGIAYSGLYVVVAMALSGINDNFGLYLSLSFALLSLVPYAFTELYSKSSRAQIVSQIAVYGLYLASLSSFFTGSTSSTTPALLLLPAAALLWRQSQKSTISKLYVAAVDEQSTVFITVASSCSWVLFNLGARELLIYTHLWAVTFAIMYYWRATAKDEFRSQNFLYLSLASLTIPFGFQVLGDSGSVRGWLFVIEHLLLMMGGMAIKNDAVIKWGLIVSVGAVLYQLRDLTYLLLGILGLSVIGVAVWLLNREGKSSATKK